MAVEPGLLHSKNKNNLDYWLQTPLEVYLIVKFLANKDTPQQKKDGHKHKLHAYRGTNESNGNQYIYRS